MDGGATASFLANATPAIHQTAHGPAGGKGGRGQDEIRMEEPLSGPVAGRNFNPRFRWLVTGPKQHEAITLS